MKVTNTALKAAAPESHSAQAATVSRSVRVAVRVVLLAVLVLLVLLGKALGMKKILNFTVRWRRATFRLDGMASTHQQAPATPFVRIDLPTVERNIAAMADFARERGLRLRPHAKTHKLVEIAKLQLEHGAVGLTVATLGEAEVFAQAGIKDLFIAFPVWPTEAARARVRALFAAGVDLKIGTDSTEAAAAWAGIDGLSLLIEVNSGHNRSGAQVGEVAAIANVAQVAGAHVAGVFTFPGHSYAPDMPADAAASEHRTLLTAAAGLGTPLVLSGGSTPSAKLSIAPGEAGEAGAGAGTDVAAPGAPGVGATPGAGAGGEASGWVGEIRPGVYVFNDAQQLALGTCTEEDIALTVETTVVSRDVASRRVIADAGSKILGSDRPAWLSTFAQVAGRGASGPADGYGDAQNASVAAAGAATAGATEGATVVGESAVGVTALSEHHATMVWPEGEELPELGSRLRLIPNHVCLVLNLVDVVYVAGASALDGSAVDASAVDSAADDGDGLAEWPVDARGANS